ncbi:MAG: hypothetical protein QOF59_576 [Actinomycetota bacterium]|jgi:predicted ester cyclase|nr:hypothetical protein [Actinomycetota bacterium]
MANQTMTTTANKEIGGSDALTSFYTDLFAALRDLHTTTLDIVADDDTVFCRFVLEGTSEGSLFGFPATGGTIRWDEIDTYHVANGMITEEWSSPDMTNILCQLGAYTPPWIS